MTIEQKDNPPQKKKKIDLSMIRRKLAEGDKREVWRSLDEITETDEFLEFLHHEFPRETSWIKHLNRREFLKILAAPLALAGLAACVPQPQEFIVPYVNAPDELVPGVPLFFATAMELDGFAHGLLVENREGRPIKVEGNPQHPLNLGATNAFAQGSLLTLYDPERSQVVTNKGSIRTWDSFLQVILQEMDFQRTNQGAGLRILTGTVTSPTFAAQIRTLLDELPQAIWHQYDPTGRDNVRAGADMTFGQIVETQYHVDAADVILSLDDDFMVREPGSLRYIREFTSRRITGEGLQGGSYVPMNRLYVVESSPSITGASADHRWPLKASLVLDFAIAIASRLGLEVPSGTRDLPFSSDWIDALAADLQEHQGASLVMAGPQQPPEVHALAHALNAQLGNIGKTVFYTTPVEANPVNQAESLRELVADLQAGEVELLVIFSENPAYATPADVNFDEAMQKAGLSVYLGLFNDETAMLSDWHIPATHYLESWNDARAFDGTVSIIQPLINPLYDGHSNLELMSVLLGNSQSNGYDIVHNFWLGLLQGSITTGQSGSAGAQGGSSAPNQDQTAQPTGAAPTPSSPGDQVAGLQENAVEASPQELAWKNALRDGLVGNTSAARADVSFNGNLGDILQNARTPVNQSGLEIVFAPDPSIWDGRFSKNAWLQELPKPITKLVWDNAALISPATALKLDLMTNDVVLLQYKDRQVEAPVYILPGVPEDSVTVHLGYGHTGSLELQEGQGFNAYHIRTSEAPWFDNGLEIIKTSKEYQLATTQDHFAMEGRNLVRTGTLEEYEKDPAFAQEGEDIPELPNQAYGDQDKIVPEPPSIYPEFNYEGRQWGMAINLNSCVGCNACVIACQAENNIPVVGKEQVLVGREMHWIRVDRYYQGDLDTPQFMFEPVPCMHCEKAPCELVCPVEATVHSSDGLNEMIYNRCIGTRYCSNNCPYKVRRFNFLQYAEEDIIPLKLMRNPEVTVRVRGVMEKCTYCVQRIRSAEINAKTNGKSLQDGDIVPACQQACPANAIVFGDINDQTSQVHRQKSSPLNYGLLADLGTQPRTTYLAQVRNPNPKIEDGA